MVFYGLQKFSLIEWPDKICAVLFVGGCNFRCPFCYNRDLVLNYQKLPKISETEVLKFLKSRKKWLEGLMISGGEPLAERVKIKNYFNDLINFIKKVRKIGYKVGIETNGSNPEMLKKIIDEKLIDFVAMDIKAPLGLKSEILNSQSKTNSKFKNPDSKYDELTGVKIDLEKIKKSIELIKNSGIDYEFRTTVAPLLSEKDILEIAQELKGAKRYALQIFQPVDTLINPKLREKQFLGRQGLEKISQQIKDYFEFFEIRG